MWDKPTPRPVAFCCGTLIMARGYQPFDSRSNIPRRSEENATPLLAPLSHCLHGIRTAPSMEEDCMTHLALQFIFANDEVMEGYGLWLFLSVGAVALFGIFLPIATWMEHRRKEREAFYKSETIRRIAEAPGQGGNAAVELLREQERIASIKTREGMKIGGIINMCVGIGVTIFLYALLHGKPVFLAGLIPALVGVAMLVYVYVLAEPAF
jgi:hypothetical protein